MIKTEILQHPNLSKAIDFVQDYNCGAVTSFIGYVRNHNEQKIVVSLFFEIYMPLAEKILKSIAVVATEKWKNINVYITHSYGEKNIGDISVIIAVASPHRKESSMACSWILEEIKRILPVWKREKYATGQDFWIHAPYHDA